MITSSDGPAPSVTGDGRPTVHVFIGTKAQYIKTAPLVRLMDARGVRYRLVDSGQHAALSVGLREELDVPPPDVVMGRPTDVESIPEAISWAAPLAWRIASRRDLQRDVFGAARGVCVVHGDTPSTLLSALMARRAGLTVAHLEAGLRSHHLLHPFPEELIRIAVMRLAHILFAMSYAAVANLEAMDLPGEVVDVGANTIVEALRHGLGDPPERGSGPVLVTMHRVENLSRPTRVEALVDTVANIATRRRVLFVQHGPTRETLRRRNLAGRLRRAGVELVDLLSHSDFLQRLYAAPYVITDGGSIQEEAALVGVPTLLWRRHTERDDGLGDNVVLADYDRDRIATFLADPQRHRREPRLWEASPSETILDRLLAELPGHARPAAAPAGGAPGV